MKRFYITGVSGTGKSTVAEELKKIGIHTIDIDSVKGLCRWAHKDTKEISHWHSGIGKEFFENHKYFCNREKLIDLMGNEEIVVVVGLADNQSEILDLFDKIFLFSCNEKTFIKRILDRTEHDFGKHSSEQEMILSWYKDYEKEMLDKGAISINTDKPLNEVIDEIVSKINY